jgi:hypothetical protein
MLGVMGLIGLLPEPPVQKTLKQKAKEKSVGAVCMKKKKQTLQVKQLCKRWEIQTNG